MSSRERRLWQGLLAVSLLVFAVLAGLVASRQHLESLDLAAAHRLFAHGPAFWTDAMLALTRVHGVAGICVVSTLWGAWFWVRGRRGPFAALVFVLGGGMLLNGILKLIFRRERPVFDEPLTQLSTYSFPSGHASGSTVFYAFVTMLVFAHSSRLAHRLGAVAGAVVMVLLVAYTRLYVGAHFLTDVVAAIAEGLAWVAGAVLAMDAWRQHLANRRDGRPR